MMKAHSNAHIVLILECRYKYLNDGIKRFYMNHKLPKEDPTCDTWLEEEHIIFLETCGLIRMEELQESDISENRKAFRCLGAASRFSINIKEFLHLLLNYHECTCYSLYIELVDRIMIVCQFVYVLYVLRAYIYSNWVCKWLVMRFSRLDGTEGVGLRFRRIYYICLLYGLELPFNILINFMFCC